jgi:hypothetical protein
MKIKYIFSTLLVLLLIAPSCDKGFEEINTNPIQPLTIDPVLQLVTAEVSGFDGYHYQAPMAQQIQLIIGGQEEGGNRNTLNMNYAPSGFGTFFGKVKELVDIMNTLKDNTNRTNLYNMARILKAYYFQLLVDTYGDVAYYEAGKAYLSGIYLPKYDDQSLIYDDLVKELTEAVNALDASKDKVTGEMYFTGDIPKWKKFGNSLLLRVGMRYTKSNSTKAATIVAIACDPARGGVMSSNADNPIVKYNSTQTSPATYFANSSTKQNWHIGLPFMNFLKINNDPRLQYISVLYSDPISATGGTADTIMAHQVGCPYGYSDVTIVNSPGFPGKVGALFKYSQVNRSTICRVDSWLYFLTYAQTQLLLAEARFRGYITTGTVKDYYETGIKAHMSQLDTYGTSGSVSPISVSRQNSYLLQPGVAFNAANALKQINEQYWVASFMIFNEGWANFRRTGYPQLTPIGFPGEDSHVAIATGGDGFIHRLVYSTSEWSVNTVNVQEAATRMGGDDFGVHVFWDKN